MFSYSPAVACLQTAVLCLQDADQTDIYQISRNWADLVKRARAKKLAPDEFNSGTFTISNLGMYGADTFDAILPPGESAGQRLYPNLSGVGTSQDSCSQASVLSNFPSDLDLQRYIYISKLLH